MHLKNISHTNFCEIRTSKARKIKKKPFCHRISGFWTALKIETAVKPRKTQEKSGVNSFLGPKSHLKNICHTTFFEIRSPWARNIEQTPFFRGTF